MAMWSRLLEPKPKRGVDGLVELACMPTAAICVYEPGPGEVAARFTWSYTKRFALPKTQEGCSTVRELTCEACVGRGAWGVGFGGWGWARHTRKAARERRGGR